MASGPSAWTISAARSLQAMGVGPALLSPTDAPNSGYTPPAPWEDSSIEVTFTTQKGKDSLNLEDRKDIRHKIQEALRSANTTNYFTDGSVDPTANTAGCGFFTNGSTASFRLSNGSSTLQAELAAIVMALREAVATAQAGISIQIFTDSMASISVLNNRENSDNTHLITSALHLIQQLQSGGTRVKFIWLPSHIDVEGNEKADAAAKEGLLLPRITISVPPSLSNIKQLIKRSAQNTIRTEHLVENIRDSPSAAWYTHATGHLPLVVPSTMPRRLSCILHRLRLGYPCWEELRDEERACDHCEEETWAPLLQYLLECEAT